jgi:hypothetical protein
MSDHPPTVNLDAIDHQVNQYELIQVHFDKNPLNERNLFFLFIKFKFILLYILKFLEVLYVLYQVLMNQYRSYYLDWDNIQD